MLEPIQSSPTIIEDNCFYGARSKSWGVIVERNSAVSMGVFIGQSTKIYDRKSETFITAECRWFCSSAEGLCRPMTRNII